MAGPDQQPEIVEVTPRTTAVVRGRVPMDQLAAFFDRSFQELARAAGEQGVAVTGPAFARYHGPPAVVADLEVGFPTASEVRPEGEVVAGSLPGGRVARLVHHGSYDELGDSWGRLQGWMAEQGLQPSSTLWEVYLTEPTPEMDPDELRTELDWLVG